MKRIYIAGKVTGEHRPHVEVKFQHAENYIKSKGFEPVNPLKLVDKDTEWENAMKTCMDELVNCDTIFLLPDWTNSTGARLEVEFALKNKQTIINGYTL